MIAWLTECTMRRHRGFSLLELSIVLIILGLLSSSLLADFSTLRTVAETNEAQRQLDNAREALLGFAISHGRLPCPAAPGGSGIESPENGGNCTNPWDGFLPAISLGLQPVNDQGYALDPWGNPIRYAITTFKNPACASTPCISSENGLRNTWNSAIPAAPDLRVCSAAEDSTGSAGSAECGAHHILTKDAVAVIFSLGRNGQLSPASSDETANTNNDRLFVSHPATAAPNPFDDQVSWISASILYSRLLAAGRLP